jgi:hypothetical protein
MDPAPRFSNRFCRSRTAPSGKEAREFFVRGGKAVGSVLADRTSEGACGDRHAADDQPMAMTVRMDSAGISLGAKWLPRCARDPAKGVWSRVQSICRARSIRRQRQLLGRMPERRSRPDRMSFERKAVAVESDPGIGGSSYG